MGVFVADFETTTKGDSSRVWAYAVCNVKNPDEILIGTTLDEFMEWCEKRKENDTIYFHNLKFDSSFIIPFLFLKGFKHTTELKDRKTRTFNTSINYKNLFYKVEVIFKKEGKKINKVTVQDSLKLVPLSVKAIAESFKLPFSKLKIAYDSHNDLPIGAPLTEKEIEYVKNDVRIVAHAINYFHERGLTEMTIGACALKDFKKILNMGEQKYLDANFKKFFPPPQYHSNIQECYKGGFTYLNPKFRGKTVDYGLVYDVNSLYPSVMRYCQLPFGTPIFGQGEYEHDPIYPLYIQEFECIFELKKGKIPTLQLKEYGRQYLTDSGGVEAQLKLTSVDLELFLEHYDVYCVKWHSYWKFKSSEGFFDEYIDKWSTEKIEAKKRGDWGMYLISKLFLNSLYGKFGSSIKEISKIPYLCPDTGIVKYEDSDPKEKEPVYLPMAAFITSYARKKSIDAFQLVMDNYNNGISKAQPVYCDTDSLHVWLNGESEEEFTKNCGLDIDDTRLGAWKREYLFTKGKFLRAKCYMERMVISEKEYLEGIQEEQEELEADKEFISEAEYKKRLKESQFSKDENGFYMMNITVAGMPSACYNQVTFNNFKIGQRYHGRKAPKTVKGGVILVDVDFTIKES